MIPNPENLRYYIARLRKSAETVEHQILFTAEYQDIGLKALSWQIVSRSIIRAKGTQNLGNMVVTTDRSDLELYVDPLFNKVFNNLIQNELVYGDRQLTTIHISTPESNNGLEIICEDDCEGILESGKKQLVERGYGRYRLMVILIQ
ncbi:MAG: hypothetical protein WCF90_02195 [Methanomicrobiales archaeon]